MKFLNQFLSEFKQQFQPTARFSAYFFPPEALLTQMLTSLPDFSGGIFSDIAQIGAAIETKTTMPILAQWLIRGVLCDTTYMPSRALETTTMRIYGYGEQFPYHTEFVPLECTFYMPLSLGDNPLPRFMNYWQNFIQDGQGGPESGMNFRFPNEYYGTLLLAMYDRKNNPTIVYKFKNVYPQTVQSVAVSWNDSSEFAKLSVSFVYSSFKVLSRSEPEVLALIAAGAAGE
jgi:hypothetical protein